MNLEKAVEFKRTLGIELTFITNVVVPAMDRNPSHDGWLKLADCYLEACKASNLKGYDLIYQDPGCVEYPSPVFKTWQETREWWEEATDIAGALELVTAHPDQQGGMGHVHIGCTAEQAGFITADLAARPYLTWCFANPMGSKFCKSIAGAQILKRRVVSFPIAGDKIVKRVTRNPHSGYEHTRIYKTIDDDGRQIEQRLNHYQERPHNMTVDDKFTVAPWRGEHKTVEWRAFDAAEDWSMQAEHIAFVQRYFDVIIKKSERYSSVPYARPVDRWDVRSMPTIKACYDMYRKNFDLCRKEFKALIEVLELPWERYKRYVDMNLKPAFEYGQRL